MDTDQLRIVKQVLEAGSVSRAASQLNKPQSVVSRHIMALEKECGGRLFYRNGRGVIPTELGERILPQVDVILKASRDMKDHAQSLRGEVTGNVRIGAIASVARTVCVPLIKTLQRDFPEITLCISEALSGDVEDDLEEGRIDIGIFCRSGVRAGREDHIIDEWQTYLIGLPGPVLEKETIKFSELAGLPLIVPCSPSFNRRVIENDAAAIGIKLNIIAEVNGPALLPQVLLAGEGYHLGSVGSSRFSGVTPLGIELKSGRLRASQIVEPSFPRLLVVSTGAAPPRSVQTVAKYIIEATQEHTCDVTTKRDLKARPMRARRSSS